MRKFVVNVNGNSYQVEVEEIGAGESVQVVSAPKAAPAAPAEAKPAPTVIATGSEAVVEKSNNKEE